MSYLLSAEGAREIQQRSLNPARMDQATQIANELIQKAAKEGLYSCNLYNARVSLSPVEEKAFIVLVESAGFRIKDWWVDVRWDEPQL